MNLGELASSKNYTDTREEMAWTVRERERERGNGTHEGTHSLFHFTSILSVVSILSLRHEKMSERGREREKDSQTHTHTLIGVVPLCLSHTMFILQFNPDTFQQNGHNEFLGLAFDKRAEEKKEKGEQ